VHGRRLGAVCADGLHAGEEDLRFSCREAVPGLPAAAEKPVETEKIRKKSKKYLPKISRRVYNDEKPAQK
jgi:hypothetical protein